MSKSKLEIIDETVKYYSNNPRSISSGNCYHYYQEGENGPEFCAFGRCCTEDNAKILESKGAYISLICSSDSNHRPSVDTFLKPEYHGHNLEFWEDIQDLHDSHGYWERDKVLSALGKSRVKQLKERYAE